eukprot:1498038-Prymnesium_polylepis.1
MITQSRAVIVNRRCPSICVDGYGTDDFYPYDPYLENSTRLKEPPAGNAPPHDHRILRTVLGGGG